MFCFVSNDFNGDLASVEVLGRKGTIAGSGFDMTEKNTWQKLEIIQKCRMDTVQLALWLAKYNVPDFSSLKGFVIFAYPIMDIVSDSNYFLIKSEKIDKLSTHQNYKLLFSKRLNTASFFRIPLISLFDQLKKMPEDPDPLRNWVAKIVSEDTTYYGLKSNLQSKTKVINFGDDRTLRWKFAYEIFAKEYNWTQKMFGGGFAFLNWYGYYFLGDKSKSDYPHNPFLHILLYSGILGLSIYLFFLYKVFYYYIIYIKEYPLLFIFFLITFFFTFFSGGSPFDPPVMGFFIILPFFIHSIHRKYCDEVI